MPAANLLGDRGGGFVVAQTRLGGGRIHHAMRTVGMARQALEMMLERAVSRRTQGELLSRKQLVQEMVADSWLELEQFRLLVLQTAWKIDRYQDYRRVRGDIAAVKVAMPTVLKNIASRALQVHGSLGLSDEMPFMKMIVNGYHVGLADGPTEVHKITLARELLAQARAVTRAVPDLPHPAAQGTGTQEIRRRPRPPRPSINIAGQPSSASNPRPPGSATATSTPSAPGSTGENPSRPPKSLVVGTAPAQDRVNVLFNI